MLDILGRTSSINVRKVLWACAELDVPFEQEWWGTGFRDTRDAQFLALNPNALVPVLRDGAFVLWESNAICRYLAAREKREDLLPRDPQPRALVEQWMDWQAGDLNTAWRYAFMALVRKSAAHTDRAAIDASAASWNRHMAMLDAQLVHTSAFVTGDTFTLADIVLALTVHRWLKTPIEHAKLPAVQAYYERLRPRKGFGLYCREDMP